MVERVLIVRTDRLGDLLLTLPMASVLKSQIPNVHVSLMVQGYTAPLLKLARDIDEVIIYDKNWSLLRKIRAFKSAKASIAFFPSPRPELAVSAFLARIPRRVGTAYRYYSPLFTVKIKDHRSSARYNEAEFNVRLLSALGLKTSETPYPNLKLREEDVTHRESVLRRLFGTSDIRYAVLHISTGGSAGSWPERDFVELARLVAHELNLPILLTGTAAERERILSVQKSMQKVGARVETFLDGSLIEFASILERADLVVSGSTGPGHLAAALGAPTLGLYPLATPLSKERWGFRGNCVSIIGPEARPKETCPNCKDCICMERIPPNLAFDALKGLLTAGHSNPPLRNIE